MSEFPIQYRQISQLEKKLSLNASLQKQINSCIAAFMATPLIDPNWCSR